MQPKHIFAALSKRDAIFMQPDNNDIIDSGMCMDPKRPNQCISLPGVRFEKAVLNSRCNNHTQRRYSCLPLERVALTSLPQICRTSGYVSAVNVRFRQKFKCSFGAMIRTAPNERRSAFSTSPVVKANCRRCPLFITEVTRVGLEVQD